MKKDVVAVKGLKKKYAGNVLAVKGVDFSFYEGQFVGLLGPNGAGKTTTINMMTGLLKPTEGEILYFGKDFLRSSKEAKNYIGVVPQTNNLDRDLTGYENLYHHALLYKIPRREIKEKIHTLIEFARLGEYTNKLARTFSGGTKRRLVIIRALLHEPKILFLDEPTVGLDPHIRRDMWDFIIKINQIKRTTILMTTHYIEEAEKLCEHVLIIEKGEIIASGTPNTLKKRTGRYVLEMYKDEGIVEEFFDNKELALNKLKECPYSCKIRESTLEDVFLTLTGKRINV